MGYSAKAVANAFLDIAKANEKGLTPLKLQKLVYIAHGWNLAINGQPLVDDEFAEAWQYGPVFPSIYHEFKEFGKSNVTTKALDFEMGDDLEFDVFQPEVPSSDEETWSLLQRVWEIYGKYSGLTLSDVTHRPDTPWSKVWNESGGRKNADISNEVIKSHYDQLAKTRTSGSAS
ncbi:Panacea domain-containing protein [Croceicoccus sp. Ery5]|uniref:Panacea domain-containing protein n=1 Tax=Croceicoccus sp. Ery5 TaxID=1703340 RepID=UPI001E558D5D|nr:type II toxin-antitoxin system antitoxin SocA domain-containing protein [Croceicoccus sp. Ery5]